MATIHLHYMSRLGAFEKLHGLLEQELCAMSSTLTREPTINMALSIVSTEEPTMNMDLNIVSTEVMIVK
jgi:hypothetical protein